MGFVGSIFGLSLQHFYIFLLMKEQCQVNLCQLGKMFRVNEVGKVLWQKYWSQMAPYVQNQVFIAGNFQVCKHRHRRPLQGKTGVLLLFYFPASLFARAYFAFVIRK